MKKAMEKVLALVIALVLVCAMSAAMAEEVPAEVAPVEEIVEVKEETKTEETVEEVVEETAEESAEEIAVEVEAEEIAEEAVIEEVTEEELPEDAQLMSVIEDKLNAGRSVSVYICCGNDELNYGDKVELYAVLKGYEGMSYEMQWQVSADNNSWSDISGENGSEYELTLTEDNADNYYRVAVTIDGVEI